MFDFLIGKIYNTVKGSSTVASLVAGILTVSGAARYPLELPIGIVVLLGSFLSAFDIYGQKQLYDALKKEHEFLESANNTFRQENDKLSVTGKTLTSEVSKLEQQVQKLKVIQDNANNLIKSLMDCGDKFQDFNKVIAENVDKLQDTSAMMEVLLIKLKDSKFTEIDKNKDGAISKEEMDTWISQFH
jgi:hypothetical protein